MLFCDLWKADKSQEWEKGPGKAECGTTRPCLMLEHRRSTIIGWERHTAMTRECPLSCYDTYCKVVASSHHFGLKITLIGRAVTKPKRREHSTCLTPTYILITSRQKKLLISYDTQPIVTQKAQYINQRGLGGAMWWELDADKEESTGGALVRTVREQFRELEWRENELGYEQSSELSDSRDMGQLLTDRRVR
jgi:hypothetical protein